MATPDGVSLRSMRLKVLYTFDAEHKNNHLARYPQPLEVHTAFVDESNQIGVIELKICLDAVLEASPELLPNNNDYNVYFCDYSEPETPLVGQGLLSRNLDLRGNEIEDDAENMVTGRIVKNVMGLFSKNAQETLEVKLRFTPVAAVNQRFRSGSFGSQDTTQQSWSGISHSQLQRPSSPMDNAGLAEMQRMLNEGAQRRDRSGSFTGGDVFYNQQSSRPASRAGTPSLGQASVPPPVRASAGMGSRPTSRAGGHPRRDSFNSGYYSGEDNIDEGPAKKRARITKVSQPLRSDLNIERQPDSLRVAASTASSVRLHRPVPINPAIALETSQALEEPVRPPTPIPKQTGRPRGRPRKHFSSNLRQASKARQSSPATDLVPCRSDFPELPASSPEETRPRSASSTPANIASSPPVLLHNLPMPSSPRLPPFHGDNDSGFMSSNFDDIFANDVSLQFDEFINNHPDQTLPDVEAMHSQQNSYVHDKAIHTPVFDEGNETEPDRMTEQPSDDPHRPQAEFVAPPYPLARSQSSLPMTHIAMASPKLRSAPLQQILPTEEGRRLAPLPLMPANDPPSIAFHRSNTWTGTMSDLPTSDAATGEDQKAKLSRKRVGKEQTKARLEAAIASGEMPPFCDNCGAIETPAWRRAYRRDFHCSWDEVDTSSLEEGACVYKEVTNQAADGTIRAFKGYKIIRKNEESDDEWRPISLCNPCGLWFHKQKCMRPPEKWTKRDPHEKRKRRSRINPRRPAQNRANGTSLARSDAPTPASDGSSPDDTATEAADQDGEPGNGAPADNNEPELPPMPHIERPTTADPTVRNRNFAVGLQRSMMNQRATRSSPLRPHGSEKQPIELDLTPKPLRRQLFPSPNKQSFRTGLLTRPDTDTQTNLPTFVRRSPRLSKIRDALTQPDTAAEAGGEDRANAEDMTLKNLEDLFDHDDDDVQLPPSTPPSERPSENVFKTPKLTPRQFGTPISVNIRRTPQPVAQQTAVAVLLGLDKTPASMTPFTRSIHDALMTVSDTFPEHSPDFQAQLPSDAAPDDSMSKAANKGLAHFDFPDLPTLNGSSPNNDTIFQFDLSDFTTDQMNPNYDAIFSTDGPMPSTDGVMQSSPPAFFTYGSSDGVNGVDEGGYWKGGVSLVDQLDHTTTSSLKFSGPTLRRSPRKRGL